MTNVQYISRGLVCSTNSDIVLPHVVQDLIELTTGTQPWPTRFGIGKEMFVNFERLDAKIAEQLTSQFDDKVEHN